MAKTRELGPSFDTPDAGGRINWDAACAQVWLQGDNLRNSTDSRNYGPVPLPLVTGRVFFKVWPLREAGMVEGMFPPPTAHKLKP